MFIKIGTTMVDNRARHCETFVSPDDLKPIANVFLELE